MRIPRDRLFIEVAKLFSQRAICGRLKVGCVITKNSRIIATGYNGPLNMDHGYPLVARESSLNDCTCDLSKPCELSIHAEANAIAYAAKYGIPLDGTTLYITHSPCLKCSELIIQAGIHKVVYDQDFRDNKGLLLLKNRYIQIEKYAEQI